MSYSIVYSLSADVEDGPTILKTSTITAEAYDVVDVVAPAAGTAIVDIHPGDTGDVNLFLMYSDNYTSLTYTIDGGSAITLDGPLVLVGAGAVALFGATCNTFTFTNAGVVRDANIKIFVGRLAEDGT
jgi:hypothetical protein